MDLLSGIWTGITTGALMYLLIGLIQVGQYYLGHPMSRAATLAGIKLVAVAGLCFTMASVAMLVLHLNGFITMWSIGYVLQ